MNVKLTYQLLHDNNMTLCFIGKSFTNSLLLNYFAIHRSVVQYSFEELLTKDQTWFDSHQFIVTAANIPFKKMVIEGLASFSPSYFSVIADHNHIGFDVTIGRGVVVDDFNVLCDGTVIGNYTTISHHCALTHGVVVGDFCHVGPFAQFLYATIGNGSYMAARTSVVGSRDAPTETVDYCNFIIGSTVTKNIVSTGTYYGNRCIDRAGSLTKKID